jgi:hypothetical protein
LQTGSQNNAGNREAGRAYQSEFQALLEDTRRDLTSTQEAADFWAWHDR